MKKLTLILFSLICLISRAQSVEPDSTEVMKLSEIVVTGSNSAVGKNLIPYTVSVIDERSLEVAGSNQLLSSLSGRIPSLFVTERGLMGFGVSNGGSGHIKIRGIGGDRASAVLMMVDGQPQFAGIYSHHIADFYSKENVERVEVLRGPGSVLYGSNAMAGVINVITKDATERGAHGTLTSQFGSYNTWLTTLSGSAKYGPLSTMAMASYNRTDGQVEKFDYKQWDGYTKIGYDLSSKWKLGVDLTLMNFKGNDPIYPALSDPESTAIYHQSVTRGETSLSASNKYESTSGVVRAYYSWGNHFIDDPRHFHSLDDRLGVLMYQNLAFRSGTDVTIGFDFNTYSGEIPMSGGNPHASGSMSTIERKRITEYSPYITAAQELWQRQLIVSAGLRVANSSMFGTRAVPQAGVVISPRHLFTLKLSAANGYRNPSFRELYLYRMANPDLKPEQLWNYEVSIGKRFSRYIDLELTGYLSQGSNMIQEVDMHNENTGRFINKGIEVTAKSSPLNNLHLTATYSWLHSSLDNLTGAPRNQYYLGVDWAVTSSVNVSAELTGVEDLFVSDGIKRQSYALLNLRGEWQIVKWVGIFLKLNNITDARYVINKGYPMPGFNAMGGFRLSI